MSEPSTLRLSVEFLSNVINVKYRYFTFSFFFNNLKHSMNIAYIPGFLKTGLAKKKKLILLLGN